MVARCHVVSGGHGLYVLKFAYQELEEGLAGFPGGDLELEQVDLLLDPGAGTGADLSPTHLAHLGDQSLGFFAELHELTNTAHLPKPRRVCLNVTSTLPNYDV